MPYLGNPVNLGDVGWRHDFNRHAQNGFMYWSVRLQILNFVVVIRVDDICELDPLFPGNFEVEAPAVFRGAHCYSVCCEVDLPLLFELGLSVQVQQSVEVFDYPRNALLYLIGGQLQLLDQTVDLVYVENRADPLFQGLTGDCLSLDHDFLDRVDDYDCTVDGSKRSCDFSGKVNMPWGIDEIDDIGCSSMFIVEAYVGGFDRHLAFLFFFHEVHRKRCPCERWREKSCAGQQAICHRCLAVVDMGDDTDVADLVLVRDDFENIR